MTDPNAPNVNTFSGWVAGLFGGATSGSRPPLVGPGPGTGIGRSPVKLGLPGQLGGPRQASSPQQQLGIPQKYYPGGPPRSPGGTTGPILGSPPPRSVDQPIGLSLHSGAGALSGQATGSIGTHVPGLRGRPSHSPYAQGTKSLPVKVTRAPGSAVHKATTVPVHHVSSSPSNGRGKPLDAHQRHLTHLAHEAKLAKSNAPSAGAKITAPTKVKTTTPTATNGSSPAPSYSSSGGLLTQVTTGPLGSITHVLILAGGAILLWYLVSHRKSLTRSVKGGA